MDGFTQSSNAKCLQTPRVYVVDVWVTMFQRYEALQSQEWRLVLALHDLTDWLNEWINSANTSHTTSLIHPCWAHRAILQAAWFIHVEHTGPYYKPPDSSMLSTLVCRRLLPLRLSRSSCELWVCRSFLTVLLELSLSNLALSFGTLCLLWSALVFHSYHKPVQSSFSEFVFCPLLSSSYCDFLLCYLVFSRDI